MKFESNGGGGHFPKGRRSFTKYYIYYNKYHIIYMVHIIYTIFSTSIALYFSWSYYSCNYYPKNISYLYWYYKEDWKMLYQIHLSRSSQKSGEPRLQSKRDNCKWSSPLRVIKWQICNLVWWRWWMETRSWVEIGIICSVSQISILIKFDASGQGQNVWSTKFFFGKNSNFRFFTKIVSKVPIIFNSE